MGWVTPVPSIQRIEQTTSSTCWLGVIPDALSMKESGQSRI